MSNSDDGTSRLSKMLDDVFGRSGTQEWSIDDPDDAHSGGETADSGRRATNGGGSSRPASPTPPTDGAAIPSDSAGAFVLPEIVPATSDPQESAEPSLPRASMHGAPITVRDTSVPVVTAPAARATPGPTPTPPSAQAPTSARWNERAVPSSPSGSLRTPGHRPRVRRVTRVLRHVDPWSTFKLALLFSLVAYVTALTSGVLLWRVAESTGTLDNVERWFTQFGWETFEFEGGEIFHNAWIIGLFGVVAATGGAVLIVTLFNLVSDIVGGVRVTVLEEEVVERTVSSTRRYVVRRPSVVDEATGTTRSWSLDDESEPGVGDRSATTRTTPSAPADGRPEPAEAPAPAADWSVDDDPPTSAG